MRWLNYIYQLGHTYKKVCNGKLVQSKKISMPTNSWSGMYFSVTNESFRSLFFENMHKTRTKDCEQKTWKNEKIFADYSKKKLLAIFWVFFMEKEENIFVEIRTFVCLLWLVFFVYILPNLSHEKLVACITERLRNFNQISFHFIQSRINTPSAWIDEKRCFCDALRIHKSDFFVQSYMNLFPLYPFKYNNNNNESTCSIEYAQEETFKRKFGNIHENSFYCFYWCNRALR